MTFTWYSILQVLLLAVLFKFFSFPEFHVLEEGQIPWNSHYPALVKLCAIEILAKFD